MRVKKFITVLVLGQLLFPLAALAQLPEPIKLFSDGVPNAKSAPAAYKERIVNDRIIKVTDPAIIPFFPSAVPANGTSVIICPGGGYTNLAITYEGYDIARKFNESGITAFVLKYRLPSDSIMQDKTIGPLQDAQRAIQLVRKRAKEWKLDTARVGIVGFSAGGHLASTAGTHFKTAVITNAEKISLRPDFMVLVYPVITFGEGTHAGSKKALIGENPAASLISLYSNQLQITSDTPPSFLVQAADDKLVPVQNSLLFYQALLKAGVKAELHIYQAGGHGFGLHNRTTADQWFDRCENWLKENKFL